MRALSLARISEPNGRAKNGPRLPTVKAYVQSGTRAQTSVRKGGIAVDEHIQTTKAGVYAAGDVTGRDEDARQQSTMTGRNVS